SPHRERAEKMGQFKVLHALIDQRIADAKRMRAEGAVLESSSEEEDEEEDCAT
ncbi:MAG: hypothetical protein Q9180_005604, partial [Flavoplaca navasiana]